MSWFSSFGLKRLVASYLSIIVEVLRAVPGTAEIISSIEMVAGLFGITGIVHTGTTGDLTKKKLSTAAAAIAAVLFLARFIPAMAPFVPILEKVAALLGAAAVGVQITK